MSDLQRVGPVYGGTGTAPPFTAGITAAQRVQDAHGRYAEAVRNGSVWTLSTAYAGVTLVAASAIGQTAWSPIVGIFNPANSGKNCNILLGFASYISGTPTAGGIVWGFVPANAGVTATGGNGAVNALTLTTGGSTAKTFIMSAMTGSAASAILAPFPASPFAGAIAATTPLGALQEVGGLFNCPPGACLGITGTLGTATLLQGFLAWEEVPVLT
jgi:hypothetical protein